MTTLRSAPLLLAALALAACAILPRAAWGALLPGVAQLAREG